MRFLLGKTAAWILFFMCAITIILLMFVPQTTLTFVVQIVSAINLLLTGLRIGLDDGEHYIN